MKDDLDMLEYYMLHEPDAELERFWRETNPGKGDDELAIFMRASRGDEHFTLTTMTHSSFSEIVER